MKKFILLSIMFGALSSTLISCGDPPKKSTESSSNGSVEGTTEDTALYIGLSTTWYGGSAPETHGSCIISTLISPGTVTDCKLRAPEGKLYYSTTSITIGTKLAEICPVIRFMPYVYRISDSDTYVPPYETSAIKCATEPSLNPKCWGGAMTQLVPTYPKANYLFNVSALSLEAVYPLVSDVDAGWYLGRSNRGVVNNLPLASRGSAQAGYTGTLYEDYKIVCEDYWAHPIYTINLTIVDEDTKGSDEHTYDEIIDWD